MLFIGMKVAKYTTVNLCVIKYFTQLKGEDIMNSANYNTNRFNFGISIVIILCMLITVQVFAQSNFLQIEGLRSNHQGQARWNADGTGPEPAATGHTMINGLPATYYFATIDYDSIDPLATSGFSFTGTATGFSNFINALSTNGFSFSDVTVKFGLYDLGNDIEGEDWWVNGNIETWKLESEQDILIQVNGEDMVGAPAPTLSAVLDFGILEWSVVSDTFLVEDRSATSSAEVQNVAAAFLMDVSSSGLKLVRPMAPNTNSIPLNANGRSGYTEDTGVWRIEMMPPTGIDEYSSFVTPNVFELHQNYPNPFNPTTTINYSIPVKSNIVLKVYNTLGAELLVLVNGEKEVGTHQINFDATGLPSGIYFYRLQAGDFIEIKKMVLMK
jgi:hypothetical protein